MVKRALVSSLSIASLAVLWSVAAAVAQSRYLPSPAEVLSAFQFELASGALLYHLGATFLRVAGAFVLAMSLGAGIGLGLGRSARANSFFDPWLIFALNVPALVTIVFCYLWIGLTEAAAVAAVAINKIPNVAVTMREGARALDPHIDDVAFAFGHTGWRKFRIFVWPQLEPYLAAAVRNGLALIWKIVLVVELIGRSNGAGFQINLYFGLFDLPRIMAYALSFMIIVWLIEALLVKPWERRARRWRGDVT
jgi:NitT/TauT family transport system permease protein